MPLDAVSLDDKYALESGRIFITGTQALVRLPMMQRHRDLAAGLNTACYVTGYRGSPLGGVDLAMWQARKFLKENHIQFQPGVNEDLAATAVWGSQQLDLFGDSKYDGVFSMWYGKGPGVDRSGDVLRHGNLAGTAKHGGVLLLAGDDHTCKSSGVPEIAGVSTYEAQRILRGLNGLDFVGGDFVELSPPIDPTGNSALVAANLGYEILCLLVESIARRRSGKKRRSPK